MKLAVDIVLLPSEKMMDRTIELNKQCDDNIRLDKENCLPHISLAMGVIDDENIIEVMNKLKEIASKFGIFNLKATRINEYEFSNLVSYDFAVEPKDEIQKLHEEVINKLNLGTDITADKCFGEVNESTTDYASKYNEEVGFEKYYPHLTIGISDKKVESELPIEFKASKIAICHLGNCCTCRKVLGMFELK